MKNKSIIKSALLILASLTFAQCSSSPLEKVSQGEKAFILSWNGLQEFQGVLWLFRDKYKINPGSYKEMESFIEKFKLNYDNPFDRLEFIADGDDAQDQTNIHYSLKVQNSREDDIPDYWQVEIEADVLVRFVSWESSVAVIQGRNVLCRLDDNGIKKTYMVDSTNIYVTMVHDKVINKLKGQY